MRNTYVCTYDYTHTYIQLIHLMTWPQVTSSPSHSPLADMGMISRGLMNTLCSPSMLRGLLALSRSLTGPRSSHTSYTGNSKLILAGLSAGVKGAAPDVRRYVRTYAYSGTVAHICCCTVCMCVHSCMHVCVCVCIHVCMCVCVCVCICGVF